MCLAYKQDTCGQGDLVPSELTAFYRVTCMDIGNEHSLVDPEDATTRDTDEEEDEDMVQNQPPPRRLRASVENGTRWRDSREGCCTS